MSNASNTLGRTTPLHFRFSDGKQGDTTGFWSTVLDNLAHPNNAQFITSGSEEGSNQKFVGPGLQVYGLGTPLAATCLFLFSFQT